MIRRIALTTAGLVLVLAAAGQSWIHTTGIQELLDLSPSDGFAARRSEALHDVRSELDLPYAGALLARALLADALEANAFSDLDPSQESELLTARSDGLKVAERVALSTLVEQPSNWQAAMVAGAANYLRLSITGDTALFTDYRRWEAPLELARALAPAQPEPTRFLTMAYLEVWPVLSAEKRLIAEKMVGDTFVDDNTFARAIGPWLEVNSSDLEKSFERLPDRAFVWGQLETILASKGEWHLAATAHRRHLESLWSELTIRTTDAIDRIEGGDTKHGRDRLLPALGAPPSQRFRGLLSRAVGALPPGPVPRSHALSLSYWVLWENDRCLFGSCTFSQPLMERLSYSAHEELKAHDSARARLSYDDLAAATLIEEKEAGNASQKEWAPYFLQKVHRLLERGEVAKAISALAAVHQDERSSPLFLQAKADVEQATGDPNSSRAAQVDLSLAASNKWPATDWRRTPQKTYRLQILTAVETSGLSVDWVQVGGNGGVVDLVLNGRIIETRAVSSPRSMAFQLHRVLPAGLHSLEVQRVAGGSLVPGAVELLTIVQHQTSAE